MWNTTTPQPSYNQMVTFQLLSLRSRHLQQPWPSGNAMPKDSKGIRWFLLVSHIIGHPLDSGLTLKMYFWLYKSFSNYVSRLLWCFLLYQPSWSKSFARCRCRMGRQKRFWKRIHVTMCIVSDYFFTCPTNPDYSHRILQKHIAQHNVAYSTSKVMLSKPFVKGCDGNMFF